MPKKRVLTLKETALAQKIYIALTTKHKGKQMHLLIMPKEYELVKYACNYMPTGNVFVMVQQKDFDVIKLRKLKFKNTGDK